MYAQSTYILKISESAERLIKKISATFLLKGKQVKRQKQQYYDTFDWRLYQNGFYLIKENNLNLIERETLRLQDSIHWNSQHHPRFHQDFPLSSLKSRLAPLLSVRALMPVLRLNINTTCINIINIDEKIVTRILLTDVKVGKKTIPLLILKTVRGYLKEFADAEKYIDSLNLIKIQKDIPTLALEALNISPGDYTSKINFIFSPDMPAHEAFKKIGLFLTSVMKDNEKGIIKDIDTEFLHDFRVAVRRTRSAISQIKDIFSPSITDEYKTRFAALGKKSNRLRDIDVYLLNRHNMEKKLPTALRPGLACYFQSLQSERKNEIKNMQQILTSDLYRSLLNDWESLLNQNTIPADQRGKNYDRPIIEVAFKQIQKRYQQIAKQGFKINTDSPAESFHRLRINCKKLRYLLEFFASLLPSNDMPPLLKRIKNLQTILGDYNDYCMQQEHLMAFLNTAKTCPQITAAAIGGLMQDLSQRQQQQKEKFSVSFRAFTKEFQPFIESLV